MSSQLPRRRTAPLSVAAGVAAALALPVYSAPPVPATQVWIDVANHNMANMPELGGMERMAMDMMGGDRSRPNYPTARKSSTTGQYLDIAILNRPRPGREVQAAVPEGLGLGPSLTLVPPPPVGESRTPGTPSDPPDVEITVREFWGCSGAVGPGQPKVSTYTVKGGVASVSGGMTPGRFEPDGAVEPTPAYALWPNPVYGQQVPDAASLVGTHRFTGDGIPASLRFELDRTADFMPRISLTSLGEGDAPIQLSWLPVERAKAYFLHAVQMEAPKEQGVNKASVTVWSSAETAGAGTALVDYLDASRIDRWLKQKVLLPASTTACIVPQGVFDTDKGMASMTMLDMVAYGPEVHLVHPAKPADPKLLAAWKPEWSARVRTKSTANLVLGMDVAAGRKQGQGQDAKKESTGKALLKGLLRRGL